jgi:hypothetical protein
LLVRQRPPGAGRLAPRGILSSHGFKHTLGA